MMPFSEKLTFLMHITEVSNKELAAELSVDPSMISLMRTGKRKLSKNPAQARKMAAFFARRCSAAFQRQALSEMLEQAAISTSMPKELLERCVRESGTTVWAEGFRMHLEEIKHFEERLRQGPYIDMCWLASAAEVRSGTVPVVVFSKDYPGQSYYTPETYCLHLKNILRLMEQYENYFFLPLGKKDCPDYNLLVNEGGLALVVRTVEPFIMLEIRRPAMATALQEHLLKKADAFGYDGIHREKIRMELRGLIQELGG